MSELTVVINATQIEASPGVIPGDWLIGMQKVNGDINGLYVGINPFNTFAGLASGRYRIWASRLDLEGNTLGDVVEHEENVTPNETRTVPLTIS